MTNLLKFASITKKITLALLGLFLMIFLLMHLGINLCMLRDDGGAWFSAAAHFMGTNYIVKIIEVILFAVILLHILLGVFIQIQNWTARPIGYKVPSRSKTSTGSKFMIYTGCLILAFLALHFVNFYFVKLGVVEGQYMVKMEDLQHADQAVLQQNQEALVALFQNTDKATAQAQPFKEVASGLTKEQIHTVLGANFTEYEPDFYTMSRKLFQQPIYYIIYLVLFVFLAFHLFHAFTSAFQTLGLRNPKYTPAIQVIAGVYTIVVFVGFSIIPLWFLFFYN
ncbi:MAG: succinate dehydrogenase cytochrome b subunit [Bacteroidales bacterium]